MTHGGKGGDGVVVYARVSTTEQSVDLQINELARFAEARGWQITETYTDLASGTNTNRRALKQLLADACAGKVKRVLIWKLDRLGRSLSDLLSILRDWQETGVDLISVRDSIDMSTTSGRMLTQLLMVFSEYEASLIRERVRAGIAAAQAKGTQFGRPRRLNHQKIRDLRAKGWTLSRIAREVGTQKSVVSKVLRKPLSQVVDITRPKKGKKKGDLC